MKFELFTVWLIATTACLSPRSTNTTATTSQTIELSIDSAANNTEETTPYPRTQETTAYPRTTADIVANTTGEIIVTTQITNSTATSTTAQTTATTATITTAEITTDVTTSDTIITFVSGLLISILLSI